MKYIPVCVATRNGLSTMALFGAIVAIKNTKLKMSVQVSSMNETTAVKRTCVLCKEPINDPVYECYWDKELQEIVFRHKDSYCQNKFSGSYFYMKKLGQVKHD